MNNPQRALAVLSLVTGSMIQAQDGGLLVLDLARMGEYGRVLSTYGPQVWPQWKQIPPLLLRKGDAEYLLGYSLPAAPPTFEPLNQQAMGSSIYRRSGHLLDFPTVMAWRMGNTWTVAIPTLPELQSAIDNEIGLGVIKLSEQFYMRAMLHEGVHAYLQTQMNSNLPLFGFVGDEVAVLKELESRPGFMRQIADEGKALALALVAASEAETRQKIREFVELRLQRRSGLPVQMVAMEQALEWKEGLTRYTEVSLMRLLGGQTNPELKLSYPSAQSTWSEFLALCTLPSLVSGALRERYTAVGAAQAFLLDRLMPGWKTRALPGGESLEKLLAETTRVSSDFGSKKVML